MDQVLKFLSFDKHEYTHWIFRSVILISIFMLRVYVTFSLFCKIWLTESVFIFREQLFRGTCFLLASNTLYYKFFLMKTSSLHWNGLHELGRRNYGRKLPVSIKCHNHHYFKKEVILLCWNILKTWQISHLHGSALFAVPLINS